MTLVSLNGVNFEGIAPNDEEAATLQLDSSINDDESTATKAKLLLQVMDIIRNAEDTVTIVARKEGKRYYTGTD